MGGKAVITREAILDKAYERAMAEGLASLSVRTVAQDCGVATGTIYNYFPDKASLVTEVVTRFWMRAIADGGLLPAAGEPAAQMLVEEATPRATLAYVKRLYEGLRETLMHFRNSWLREITLLDARTLEHTRAAERACFRDIVQGLEQVIERDCAIREELRGRVAPQDLAEFVWTSLFTSLRAGDRQSATLFALLELALYK